MNSVDSLLKQPFSTRTFAEKVQIKIMGKPTPELNIVQTAKGRKASTTYTRRFHSEVYEKYSWMCGCEIRNALYCFPCLLFGNQDSWSRNGIKDLGHLSEYANKHMATKKHMGNVLDLNNFGSVNVAAQLRSAYSESINRTREDVERNRYVLSKIIDCIKFCGEFDLALRGHFETENSSNSGIFPGLVNLIASVDSAVKNDLVTSTVAQWTSKTVQNELLQCMLDVCREKIKQELQEAKFVAVMTDETTDVSEHMQMIIVYRYETQGAVYERFWGFSDTDGQTSSDISRCLLAELDGQFHSTPTKIVAQTFAVMRKSTSGVQSKIKERYPLAHYVHCYTHQLNLLMESAASQNQAARVFFSSLSGFPAFFAPQRMSVLEKISEGRIVADSLTETTINCVFENKEALVDCFLVLEQSFSKRTVQEARGLRRCLEDGEFLFWLDFFHKLMPHVTILYDQLQMKNIHSSELRHSVETFRKIATELLDSLDASTSEQPGYVIKSKRVKMECNRVADAKEVCDQVIVETECRFESTSHLDISKLLDPENFKTYSVNFPEKLLELAVNSYPMLNRGKLMSELSLLYERSEFTNAKGAIPLLKFLYSNNLIDVFGETATLLRLIVTIPMTTEEPGRCFSSMKRIKTFLRNAGREESLTALAMISIEKNLVANITDFNSKTIDRFAHKTNRRADLIF